MQQFFNTLPEDFGRLLNLQKDNVEYIDTNHKLTDIQ